MNKTSIGWIDGWMDGWMDAKDTGKNPHLISEMWWRSKSKSKMKTKTNNDTTGNVKRNSS